MKTMWLVLTLLLAGCVSAQEKEKVFNLGEIVWDSKNCVLTWTVEEGVMKDDKFQRETAVRYKIDFRVGVMSNGKEARAFSLKEAERMDAFMHALVTAYVMQSTEWWFDPGKFEQPAEQPKEDVRKL